MKNYSIGLYGLFPFRSGKNNRLGKYLIGLMAVAASAVLPGCESEETFDAGGTVLPPVAPQEIVRVAPDDGVTRVNSLPLAIAANGDAVYELERDGIYYLEGKNVIKSNVVIRAAAGTGERPTIQPLSDAQGALNADMLRFEKNATFENIYFNGRDAATGNIMQRLFRIDNAGVRLVFDGCFVEYCKNFCIRTDNTGNKIYIRRSTFRNLALTSDPANGRLFDSRGNAQDTISITNSTIYNNTAHLARFDNAIMNYFGFQHNTVYNVGFHMQINYAMTAVIEDNIFANMGWKASYDPASPGAFWDIKAFGGDDAHPAADVRLTIRNNNVFSSPEIEALYKKYPGNIARIPLNATGRAMIGTGQLIYENNISEVLAFDRPSPLPMRYIDKFFEVLNTGMSPWADLPFYVDENGTDGFTGGDTYTFAYPAGSVSSTASTTGGPLGSDQWNR